MTYPWLADEAPALAPLIARPPNALLFLDPQRENAHALARHYLQALLCHSPQQGQPCGHCQSCHLVARGLHPDYHYHEDKRKIENIRDLNDTLTTTPAISARRAIYLGNIDRYDDPALNALLKTLEEPQTHSHFCLSATNRLAVKPTILSRARPWRVPQPDAAQSLAFLLDHGLSESDAQEALAREHGNPHQALAAAPLPPWQLDALVQFCRAPNRDSALFRHLETIPGDHILDWLAAQTEHLIRQSQLDNPLQTWQNSAASGPDPLRLHRLYAALSRARHPARKQAAQGLAVKALLLETLDPRNPVL